MLKNKTKIFHIFSLVLALVMLTGVTYSWYAGRKEVEIMTDSEVSIGVDLDGLEIAVDGKSFVTNLMVSENLKLADISGDGLNFLYPNTLQSDDLAPTLKNDFKVINFANANETKNFLITFKLTFRTKRKLDIFLSSDSYVKPKSYSYNNSTDVASAGSTITRRSSGGGEFSTDLIAGSARVAIVDETGSSVKNVWVPNPYVQLTKQGAAVDANTCKTNGVIESYTSQYSDTVYDTNNPYGYVYLDGNEVKETVYTIDDYANGLVTIGKYIKSGRKDSDPINSELATAQNANNAKKLLSFDGSTQAETKSVIVRIWFEGTDREADRLLNGGLVDFNLKFVGISKSDPTEASLEKLNGLTRNGTRLYYNGSDVDGGDTAYEYSQNGYYWWDYNSTSEVASGNYVRIKENSNYYHSVARKMS